MICEEKVNYCFPEDKYFKVGVRFTKKTDPKYNEDQLDFHLGNKKYDYIIRGDRLAYYLLFDNDCDTVISEGGRFLSHDCYMGLPLVFIRSPFYHYENAVVITDIKEATSADCNKLVKIIGVTPFNVVRKEFPGNNNLYSSELIKGCRELVNQYTENYITMHFENGSKFSIIKPDDSKTISNQSVQIDSFSQSMESTGEALKTISTRLSKFENTIKNNYNNYTINEKEQKNMFGIQNLEFGKYKGTDVKMSIYGPAFTVVGNGQGTWLSFDKNNELIDVTDMLIDNIPLMVMPTSPESLSEGDFIHYTGVWMQVREIDIDGTITAYRLYDRTIQKVLPTKNIFGFNYYTKLITFNFGENADSDNPFGNLLPLMMFSEGNKNNDNLLPLMLMSNNTSFNFKSNPMLLYMMMSKDSDNTNWIPFMFMNK